MREREMRQRVERFLQSRLRNMLMPATLGLGLALGGCSSNATMQAVDAGTPTANKDAGSPSANKDAGMPDSHAGPDTQIADGNQAGPDAGAVDAQTAIDAGITDAGQGNQDVLPVAKYMAPMLDAAADLRDSGMILRYAAPIARDAAPDIHVVALYMAQLPIPR